MADKALMRSIAIGNQLANTGLMVARSLRESKKDERENYLFNLKKDEIETNKLAFQVAQMMENDPEFDADKWAGGDQTKLRAAFMGESIAIKRQIAKSERTRAGQQEELNRINLHRERAKTIFSEFEAARKNGDDEAARTAWLGFKQNVQGNGLTKINMKSDKQVDMWNYRGDHMEADFPDLDSMGEEIYSYLAQDPRKSYTEFRSEKDLKAHKAVVYGAQNHLYENKDTGEKAFVVGLEGGELPIIKGKTDGKPYVQFGFGENAKRISYENWDRTNWVKVEDKTQAQIDQEKADLDYKKQATATSKSVEDSNKAKIKAGLGGGTEDKKQIRLKIKDTMTSIGKSLGYSDENWMDVNNETKSQYDALSKIVGNIYSTDSGSKLNPEAAATQARELYDMLDNEATKQLGNPPEEGTVEYADYLAKKNGLINQGINGVFKPSGGDEPEPGGSEDADVKSVKTADALVGQIKESGIAENPSKLERTIAGIEKKHGKAVADIIRNHFKQITDNSKSSRGNRMAFRGQQGFVPGRGGRINKAGVGLLPFDLTNPVVQRNR